MKNAYDKAIADYNAAIGLSPSYVGAFINRGNTWLAKHEIDHAIADYSAAIRLDPRSVKAHLVRRCVADREGDRRSGRGHPNRPEGRELLCSGAAISGPIRRRRRARL